MFTGVKVERKSRCPMKETSKKEIKKRYNKRNGCCSWARHEQINWHERRSVMLWSIFNCQLVNAKRHSERRLVHFTRNINDSWVLVWCCTQNLLTKLITHLNNYFMLTTSNIFRVKNFLFNIIDYERGLY